MFASFASTNMSFYDRKQAEVSERYKQYVENGRLELILGYRVLLIVVEKCYSLVLWINCNDGKF